MKVNAKYLQRLITKELALFTEGCGEAVETGHECPDCAAGHECGCDSEEGLGNFENLDQTNISPDERLLTKGEALRVVAAIAQNTSCPVTRDALTSVVDDLSSSEGEEWSLEDNEHESESFEDDNSEASHGGWSDWAVSGGSDFDVPDKRLDGG